MAVTVKGNIVRMTAANDVYGPTQPGGKIKIQAVRLSGGSTNSQAILQNPADSKQVMILQCLANTSDECRACWRTDEQIKLTTLSGTGAEVYLYLE